MFKRSGVFLAGIFACLILSPQESLASRRNTCDYNRQVRVLALNIYHEARGESRLGRQMVAEVTMNRVASPNYPNDICRVVYQRSQFSWTTTRRNHTPRDMVEWELALEMSRRIISGRYTPRSNGATHFYNPSLVNVRPDWARRYTRIARVGNHVFYRQS
jgi:N-acetylmuramoyl-L-alanine amidase